jgi:hypothetical protein
MAPTPALLRIFISEKWANGKKVITNRSRFFLFQKKQKHKKENCLVS